MKTFFAGLRHRKAAQVALAYAIVGWLIIQISAATFGPLHLPGWSLTLLIILVIAGFPLAVIFAWSLDKPGERAADTARTSAAAAPSSGSAPETEPNAPPPAPRSIAVLPFVDMSPERDQAYFCEGVAEEILNTLTRLPELRVASRTASFQFQGQTVDIAEIGRRLKVASVLEGSVRKAGDHLRVTAQLVNVADGYHLWSERFDSRTTDVFAIQDEIAARVARALELKPLADPGVARTSDIDAYDYYLRGWKYFHATSRHGFEHARQMFERAIEKDPGFARAWAGLADAAAFLYVYFEHEERNRKEATEASEKALALCDTIAETHASRGVAFMINKQFDQADTCFRRAIEINPRLFEPYYFYARSSVHQGKYEQAAVLFEKAHEIDPEDYESALLLPQIYEQLKRPDKVAYWRRRGVEAAMHRLDREPDDVRAMHLAAQALVALGERERGLELAERALELQPDDPFTLYNVACVYCRAGLLDKAMDVFERGAGQGEKSNYSRSWVEHDPDLAPFADNPRFKALLARLD
ncbi:MAG: tetratricopeptide repeat protein [Gammaproteobacteria bacterium]